MGTEKILEEPGSGIADGLVKYGITRIRGNPAETVSGSLITIDFKVKKGTKSGAYPLDLHDVTLKDENNKDILPIMGVLNITFYSYFTTYPHSEGIFPFNNDLA